MFHWWPGFSDSEQISQLILIRRLDNKWEVFSSSILECFCCKQSKKQTNWAVRVDHSSPTLSLLPCRSTATNFIQHQFFHLFLILNAWSKERLRTSNFLLMCSHVLSIMRKIIQKQIKNSNNRKKFSSELAFKSSSTSISISDLTFFNWNVKICALIKSLIVLLTSLIPSVQKQSKVNTQKSPWL